MTLNELSRKAYEAAKEKGFYDKPVETGTRLMLIVSEVAEALEADRKNIHADLSGFNGSIDAFSNRFENYIKDTFEDEIADTFIRLFDLCGHMGIDIERHIELKMRYNATRPQKHGKAY